MSNFGPFKVILVLFWLIIETPGATESPQGGPICEMPVLVDLWREAKASGVLLD